MLQTVSSGFTPAPRGRSFLAVCVAFITVTAAAYFAWNYFSRPVDERAGLQFTRVQRGNIEDVVTATGTLQPRDYVDVGAQVSGQLEKIHVEIGSEVASGDLLAEIDPTVLQSKVDATRAQLRNQRAQLMDREASLLLAQTQYQRQKNLMTEDATTAEALQTAEATLRSAQAQMEVIKAQIEQTESNLRADEANLEYTRIYAPMAGTVVSITARQGQTLNANQSAPIILQIADLSTMTVQTQVSEADVSKLKLGMDVYFTTLGNPNQRWYGKLHKIEPTPTVTNNVVLYNALFDVPNTDRTLMTQMTAQVFFVIASAHDALMVPLSALNFAPSDKTAPSAEKRSARDGQPSRAKPRPREEADSQAQDGVRSATIRVVSADGRLVTRSVQVGATNRIYAQILEGLEEGEEVVSGLEVGSTSSNGRSPLGMGRH